MSPRRPSSSLSSQLTALLDFKEGEKSPIVLLDYLKQYLQTLDSELASEFTEGTNVRTLVRDRARYLDKMLTAIWHQLEMGRALSLIAVGGYGRGELHPFSDIDLLILIDKSISQAEKESIEIFITLLWDCRLKVGHAVRTAKECISLAKDDLTIATNLMESRLLVGNPLLFDQMRRGTAPDKIWNAKSFFEAKTVEQKHRYKRFDGTSFDLEPNVKSSPGGLRDIHLLGWIAQRTYYPKTLQELINENLITQKEYYSLSKCQLYLWRVRYALHLVSNKAEDRLLFDYQKKAAKLLGFKDSSNALAVEKMMKQYYRSALLIRNLCDILLQVMEESITNASGNTDITEINEHFQIVNQRVEAKSSKLFVKQPSQLLKIFQYVAKDPTLKGIGAKTLRAIRAARYKITSSFRNNSNNKELFVEFWHILHTSSRAMFLMKRSGILADYLVPFKQISGQMQYDMFHSYTVDEHTLFLLQNLTNFADPSLSEDFPLCSEIMQRQKHPELIFLAGLFHDIAKGRGGDHSELGAIEVKEFCRAHKIDPEHSAIIEWLVANHLIMSMTAQKRDITDPRVIQNFAKIVGNVKQLELLYILTVADIRATSHSLWNSWKDSLLKELYQATKEYLANENVDLSSRWKTHRDSAYELLEKKGVDEQAIMQLWQNLHSSYFAKRSPKAIAWHTEKVLKSENAQVTVGIKSMPHRSGTEIFVYTFDKENLFALLTATISQLNLRIQAANIYTDKSGRCFDSFFVLDDTGKAIKGKEFKSHIRQQIESTILSNLIPDKEVDLTVRRRTPRQFKYFTIKPEVYFYPDEYTKFTRLEMTARDFPGLLATVGKTFKKCGVRLHDARITTLGEKVEDTFIVSNKDNSPIQDSERQAEIAKELIQALDES
ncbi:[protein-PII] uridylyltransferase [Aliikangiella sp. G2MR2-5]|uniref:[protein-PII] uridylyltransferase n=1 Tax=Aliikangiella sp. G2MR2-5 TaxID=2788943 RepID=UPI0018AC3823|nr:[protein-PII] uridylyltransferase [Aliikangiella sp. G2MR2-5]